MNIEVQARDIVFPIIKVEKVNNELKMLELLGTGFYLNHSQNIGMTAYSVIENTPIKDIYCSLVINNKFVHFNITNPQYGLGVVTFSILCPPINYCGIHINNQQHYASGNFFLWGYPNEYLHELSPELFRPDIAYHQGYVVRRITMKELHKHSECLFEINLVLSEGCHGAPLLIRDINNWQLIGIYVGNRKFIIEKGYQEVLQLINSDNKFFEKLKSDKENPSIKELLKEIINLAPGSIALKFIFNSINRFNDKKSEVELLGQIIKTKEQFKEIFKQIHDLISKEVHAKYGLAIRASHLFEKI